MEAKMAVGLANAALMTSMLGILVGCVTMPPAESIPATPTASSVAQPPPSPDLYAYPLRGQPPDQQNRDRYECSQWATQQTGFDPSAPGVPPHERLRVVAAGPPPGTNTAIGAVAGAILGSAFSGPRQGLGGAIAGAIVGGAIGSVSDAANAANVQRSTAAAAIDRRAAAAVEQRGADYRRALEACLDARGYSIG